MGGLILATFAVAFRDATTQIVGPTPTASFAPATSPRTVADFPEGRYRAEFSRAKDGDTVVLRVVREIPVRIAGIDTSEMHNNAHGKANPVAAKASRDYLTQLLAGKTVYVAETGRMTFERTVANLYMARPDGTLIDVGAEMVRAGHARISLR